MSLESKISDLTASIDRLYGLLESRIEREAIQSDDTPLKEESDIQDSTDSEPAAKEVKKTPNATHADLKSACLLASRASSGNKAKVRDILAEYSAVKAADVPENKILEVIDRLEALL